MSAWGVPDAQKGASDDAIDHFSIASTSRLSPGGSVPAWHTNGSLHALAQTGLGVLNDGTPPFVAIWDMSVWPNRGAVFGGFCFYTAPRKEANIHEQG